MFGGVWKWAGKYRKSDKNIGVPFWDIPSKLKVLIEDAALWVKSEREQADWIAARFHHRLVSIHPFSNGNGRHARLMADLMLVHVLNRPRFTWGSRDTVREMEVRRAYLSALRQADQRNYQPLLTFVRC